MKISKASGDYEVIDSGVLFAYSPETSIKFHLSEGIFQTDILIEFEKDETGKQVINRKIANNVIYLKCMNFNDGGTGTSIPLEIFRHQGRKYYFSFWAYLDGDYVGKQKTRKIEYTFYCVKVGERSE